MLKIVENLWAVEAPPGTLLGDLTAIPRTPRVVAGVAVSSAITTPTLRPSGPSIFALRNPRHATVLWSVTSEFDKRFSRISIAPPKLTTTIIIIIIIIIIIHVHLLEVRRGVIVKIQNAKIKMSIMIYGATEI